MSDMYDKLKEWVFSMDDNVTVGITWNGQFCLLRNFLDDADHVFGDGYINNGEKIEFPEDVKSIIAKFDALDDLGPDPRYPPTRYGCVRLRSWECEITAFQAKQLFV